MFNIRTANKFRKQFKRSLEYHYNEVNNKMTARTEVEVKDTNPKKNMKLWYEERLKGL